MSIKGRVILPFFYYSLCRAEAAEILMETLLSFTRNNKNMPVNAIYYSRCQQPNTTGFDT